MPRTATTSAVPATSTPKFVIVTPNTRPGTPVSTVNQPSPTTPSVINSGPTPTLVKIVSTPSVAPIPGKAVMSTAQLSKLVVLQNAANDCDSGVIKSETSTPIHSRPGTPEVTAYVPPAEIMEH